MIKYILPLSLLLLVGCGEAPNKVYSYNECQNFNMVIYRSQQSSTGYYGNRLNENCNVTKVVTLKDFDTYFTVETTQPNTKNIFDRGAFSYQITTWK